MDDRVKAIYFLWLAEDMENVFGWEKPYNDGAWIHITKYALSSDAPRHDRYSVAVKIMEELI